MATPRTTAVLLGISIGVVVIAISIGIMQLTRNLSPQVRTLAVPPPQTATATPFLSDTSSLGIQPAQSTATPETTPNPNDTLLNRTDTQVDIQGISQSIGQVFGGSPAPTP